MAKLLKLRRGTAAQHDDSTGFTGAVGEVTVDTTNKTLRVHDGSTKGGSKLAKASEITGFQASDAELTAIAGLTSAADKGIQFTGSGTAGVYDLTAFAKTILDDADAAAVRTTIGAQASGSYQASDADLTAIAGLTSAADKGIQFTGSGTAGTYDLTAFAKTILDDADAAAVRTTIGAGTGSGDMTLAGAQTVTGNKLFNAAARAEITGLTDASTIAVDFALSNHFSVTLGDNRTLGQPSNQVPGQSGSIFITQDGTGSRTLGYHADWKWVGGSGNAPTLTTTAGAVDRIDYIVAAANKIHAVASLDVK